MLKKIIHSIVRTIFALAIIAISLWCLWVSFNWKALGIPDNSFGFFLVAPLLLYGPLVLGYGIYFITPKFWEIVIYLILFKDIPGERKRLINWINRHNMVYLW